MTRKHFEALAAALKDSKPDVPPGGSEDWDWNHYREALAQWRADVQAIAAVCLAHNPRFANSRFDAAAGFTAISWHNSP